MAKYYDEMLENKNNLLYEFISDLCTSIILSVFWVYFIIRIVRNLKQQFIDILKIFQLSLVIVIWVRIITYFVVRITTEIEYSELFLTIFTNLLNSRMLYWSLCQFSWYILYIHLKTYKMMANGKPYSDCK